MLGGDKIVLARSDDQLLSICSGLPMDGERLVSPSFSTSQIYITKPTTQCLSHHTFGRACLCITSMFFPQMATLIPPLAGAGAQSFLRDLYYFIFTRLAKLDDVAKLHWLKV